MKEQKYLTIHKFAALRDVNINSLRYYEKLGILLPAWTDPRTKYRYYLPEQLSTLDTILLCIQLGIPLKTLTDYIDRNGDLNEKAIWENGEKVMKAQIAKMQQGMALTKFHLNSIEQNQKYQNQKGVYSRRIGERYFLEAPPFTGDWSSFDEKEQTVMGLFRRAQEQNMVPVFPAGLRVQCGTNPISCSFFVQVLRPQKAVQLRDFNPGKNIGIVLGNPAMPIFQCPFAVAA